MTPNALPGLNYIFIIHLKQRIKYPSKTAFNLMSKNPQ